MFLLLISQQFVLSVFRNNCNENLWCRGFRPVFNWVTCYFELRQQVIFMYYYGIILVIHYFHVFKWQYCPQPENQEKTTILLLTFTLYFILPFICDRMSWFCEANFVLKWTSKGFLKSLYEAMDQLDRNTLCKKAFLYAVIASDFENK